MIDLHYKVKREEVFRKTAWVGKVLGDDYGKYKSRERQRNFLNELGIEFSLVKEGAMGMEEFNRELRSKVEEFEVRYPDEFTYKAGHGGLGWWEVKALVACYCEGSVVLNGTPSEVLILARAQIEAQAIERAKVKQALAIAELKEKEEAQAERDKIADYNRTPVVVGMRFPCKWEVDKAYVEVIDAGLAELGERKTNQAARRRELDKCVKLDKVLPKGWEVTEVLKEGGRKW